MRSVRSRSLRAPRASGRVIGSPRLRQRGARTRRDRRPARASIHGVGTAGASGPGRGASWTSRRIGGYSGVRGSGEGNDRKYAGRRCGTSRGHVQPSQQSVMTKSPSGDIGRCAGSDRLYWTATGPFVPAGHPIEGSSLRSRFRAGLAPVKRSPLQWSGRLPAFRAAGVREAGGSRNTAESMSHQGKHRVSGMFASRETVKLGRRYGSLVSDRLREGGIWG